MAVLASLARAFPSSLPHLFFPFPRIHHMTITWPLAHAHAHTPRPRACACNPPFFSSLPCFWLRGHGPARRWMDGSNTRLSDRPGPLIAASDPSPPRGIQSRSMSQPLPCPPVMNHGSRCPPHPHVCPALVCSPHRQPFLRAHASVQAEARLRKHAPVIRSISALQRANLACTQPCCPRHARSPTTWVPPKSTPLHRRYRLPWNVA